MSLYLPILMYHQVGSPGPGEGHSLFVPPETFREQLDFLSDKGFRAVGPDELAAALAGPKPEGFPDRPLMISFDDADARSLGPALEALAERSWPAAGYFVAGAPETFPAPAQVEDLRQARFTVGSHCVTHRRLTGLSAEAMYNELVESRRRLEVRVGYSVDHLAYPGGAFGKRELAAAREAGYRTALTIQRGNRHRRREALRLRRVMLRPDTSLKRLGRYLTRAWHLEHVIKERLHLERRGQRR